MNRQPDLEIFVRACPRDGALDWAPSKLGLLAGPFRALALAVAIGTPALGLFIAGLSTPTLPLPALAVRPSAHDGLPDQRQDSTRYEGMPFFPIEGDIWAATGPVSLKAERDGADLLFLRKRNPFGVPRPLFQELPSAPETWCMFEVLGEQRSSVMGFHVLVKVAGGCQLDADLGRVAWLNASLLPRATLVYRRGS